MSQLLNTTQDTLAYALWPAREKRAVLRNAVLVVGGTLAIWLSAKIQIPFHPVPLTMQTFVILALSMAYGYRLATATLLLYLAEGLVGLPVFAGTPEKGIGLAYMAGTTGGYLIGFLLAAAACGRLADRGWGKNVVTTAAAMLIGNVIIYIPGLLWLAAVVGLDKPIFEWGLTPFLLGDLTKLILATAILPALWRFVRKT